MPPCERVALSARFGESCITSRKFVFERKEDGWLDKASGLIWHDDDFFGRNYNEHSYHCKSEGALVRAPSGYPRHLNGQHDFPNQDSDLVTAEEHGFFEVVGRRGFWSSSKMNSTLSRGRNVEQVFKLVGKSGQILAVNVDDESKAGAYHICVSNFSPTLLKQISNSSILLSRGGRKPESASTRLIRSSKSLDTITMNFVLRT